MRWFNKGVTTTIAFIRSFIQQWHYSPWLGPALFFSSVITFTQSVGLLGRVISPSQGRYLHAGQHKQNKRTHRHPCLWVRFELTIPEFERAKTVHASDREATVIGPTITNIPNSGPLRINMTAVSSQFTADFWESGDESTKIGRRTPKTHPLERYQAKYPRN
jgi:hypothetical protein